MKLIIAGPRDLPCSLFMIQTSISNAGIDRAEISEVVCGMATGVDTMGKEWAKSHGIPVKPFYPDWKQHGKAAGPIRNRQMAEYADALVAIWDGKSKGTKDMIRIAALKGLRVYVETVNR